MTHKTVTVYDKDNEPHTMTPLNARDMLNHNGWTTSPVDRDALAKGEARRAEILAQAEASDVQIDMSAIHNELNGKSKSEMIALAFERFGEKIDGRKSEGDVIDTIIELTKIAASAPVDEDEDADEDEDDDDDADAGEGEGADETNSTD